MRIISIIPARSGSKRVKNKNMEINGVTTISSYNYAFINSN